MFELTVILKDSERTYKHKFPLYEVVTVSQDDPHIRACIKEAKDIFVSEPESITVKIHLEVV